MNLLPSRVQEYVLAAYHPLAKLCFSGCPYLEKIKSIQRLGLGREHVHRGMYFISGIFHDFHDFRDLREYAGNRKM